MRLTARHLLPKIPFRRRLQGHGEAHCSPEAAPAPAHRSSHRPWVRFAPLRSALILPSAPPSSSSRSSQVTVSTKMTCPLVVSSLASAASRSAPRRDECPLIHVQHRVRHCCERRDREGRHLLSHHRQEAPSRTGDRAREPSPLHLPRCALARCTLTAHTHTASDAFIESYCSGLWWRVPPPPGRRVPR